ncbi:MAG TPA: UbiA family prenyltransferase [Anaerovoracaceae bacterium]|nr:UbiA family prenyltransferase [Anaerovoracaceae bacterium]
MINRFLNYIEIRTKITSTFAFLLTIAYLFYAGQPIRWNLTLVFFASMFLFDLTTTAINNYIDTKTNGLTLPFKRGAALAIIIVMLSASAFLGLYLVFLTDIVVLLLGGLCFLCGIFYTYGPAPISRQPWGELLSGIFYGFFIPFILLYVNMPEGYYLTLNWDLRTVSIDLQVFPLFTVLLLSVAPVCCTADIMLANNICDLEHDILVKRYTLPYYLGKKTSLFLFAAVYYTAYLTVIVMAAVRVLHPLSLLLLVTLIPVRKNIKMFFREQVKSMTFIASIRNYLIIMGTLTALVFLSGLIGR